MGFPIRKLVRRAAMIAVMLCGGLLMAGMTQAHSDEAPASSDASPTQ